MAQVIFFQKGDISFFEFRGGVQLEEILYIFVNHFMKQPTPHLVWIFSHGSIRQMDPDAIHQLIEAFQPYHELRPEGKSAFVTFDRIGAEMTRMFARVATSGGHPQTFGFFESKEEAVAWIQAV